MRSNPGNMDVYDPSKDQFRAVVEGVYTYRVDDDGKVVALRAFWEADAITFVPAPG